MKTNTMKYIKPRDENSHDVHPLIIDRWSPRAFSQEKISDQHLQSLFEAARWAASSMNEQPWRFIYAFNREPSFEKILETLMEGNRKWAKDASVLIVTVYREKFTGKDRENKAAVHDLGLSVGNMSLQATDLGIGLHQMAGFDPEKAKDLLNIPDGFSAFTAIALGYFGTPDQLEEPYKTREMTKRIRKEINEFAFHGQFDLEKEKI